MLEKKKNKKFVTKVTVRIKAILKTKLPPNDIHNLQ